MHTYCRFLYEYSRRHPEFSAQMLLRIGKGYEDLLDECCKTGSPDNCCSRGVSALHNTWMNLGTQPHSLFWLNSAYMGTRATGVGMGQKKPSLGVYI